MATQLGWQWAPMSLQFHRSCIFLETKTKIFCLREVFLSNQNSCYIFRILKSTVFFTNFPLFRHSVRLPCNVLLLGSSSIWTCQILNMQYLLLFSPVEKIRTNIQISTRPNRWTAKNIHYWGYIWDYFRKEWNQPWFFLPFRKSDRYASKYSWQL